VSLRTGRAAVFTMAADGSGQVQRSPLAVEAACPAWSPDGRTIAFCATDDTSGPSALFAHASIWMMGADGSQPRRVVANTDAYAPIHWSPDGTRVAFLRAVTEGGGFQLGVHVARADGSGERSLTPAGSSEAEVAWAPDSRHVLIATSHGLFISDVVTGERVELQSIGSGGGPDWSG
jgi:TolB protein